MNMVELRKEFCKNENCKINYSNTDLSLKILAAIHQNKEIRSIGPKRSKVYYLKGQEKMAEAHLNQPRSSDEKQEIIFSALIKPMTKNEIITLFPTNVGSSATERLLKELVSAKLVVKVKFAAGNKGGKKYASSQLFGNIACKTYFFRFDNPEQLVDLVIQSIPHDNIEDSHFQCSVTHHLKRILPHNAYVVFEEKMEWRRIEPQVKSVDPRLDDYLQ